MLDQIFAHAHQRPGAARREIETAEKLLAGRLHRPQERLKAARVRSLIVASPSGAKLLLVGVEVMRKTTKEVETLFHSKAGVEVEDLAGERHPRGFLPRGPTANPGRGPRGPPETVSSGLCAHSDPWWSGWSSVR